MRRVLVQTTIKCELPPELKGKPNRGATVLVIDKINWLQEDPNEPPGVIVHFDNGESARVLMNIDELQKRMELCYRLILDKDKEGIKLLWEP